MATQGKRVELELYCALTEDEVRSRTMMLVETVQSIDETKSAQTEAAKQFRERLTGLQEKQRDLSKVLRDGAEKRMVSCVVLFHVPVEGTKRMVRLDTGEIAREEAMSVAECQLNIWNSPDDFTKFMSGQGVEDVAAEMKQDELPLNMPAEEDLPAEEDPPAEEDLPAEEPEK